jgi:hypothetical protein
MTNDGVLITDTIGCEWISVEGGLWKKVVNYEKCGQTDHTKCQNLFHLIEGVQLVVFIGFLIYI